MVPSVGLSASVGSSVVLKCENLQHTGSFKARGAVSKVLSLSRDELDRGVITASTGNHGAAVAYAGAIVGFAPIVVVPEDANPYKLRPSSVSAAASRFTATTRWRASWAPGGSPTTAA